MGSDYSASVLPFRSLHGSASQWLSRCSLVSFVPRGFPLPFRLISHPFRSIPLTRLRCLFSFALPCFAPTAVPQVLAVSPLRFLCFFPASVLRAFCFLSSAFGLSDLATQLSRSSVPLLPSLTLRQFRSVPSASFVASVSTASFVWFPIRSLPFLLTWFSASFPFILPNFAPAAVPLVLALSSASFPPLLLQASVLCFRFLSVPSALGSDYSAFRFFRSLLPGFPSRRFFPVPSASLRFVSSAPFHFVNCFPLRLFPSFTFRFGTWLSCNSLSIACFASQVLPSCLSPLLRFVSSALL